MKKAFLVKLILVLGLTTANVAAEGIWTQKADMPTTRYCLSCSEVDGKVYAIGGWDAWTDSSPLATVEMYDPATDTWEKKADMPTARGVLATAVLDGKIYAMGGAVGMSSMRTVEVYDPTTDTWEEGVSMNAGRWFHSAVVVNGKIYVIGGAFSSTIEEYDPSTRTWTSKASMPTDRWVFGIGVVNGRIYVVGGDTSAGVTSSVLEYDPRSDSWTQKNNMPTARAGLGAAVVHGRVYCIGGSLNPNSSNLPALEVYNPVTDAWETKAHMLTPRGDLSVTTANGKIYAIGGFSDRICPTVEEYDPSPLIVDFNGDGIVDGADMSIVVDYWQTDYSLCDIAPRPFGDGIVDVQDLIMLSEYLTEVVDDPTLTAHWALDEAEADIAYDSAGQNDAFVIGDPLWLPEGGRVGGALQLDGIDDCVIAGPVQGAVTGSMSVLAWVKGGAPGQAIISEPGGPNWLSLDAITGCLMTELTCSGRGASFLISQTVVDDGDWHRVGFVWDGANRTLLVDGVAVAQDTQTVLESPGNGLRIGTGQGMEPGTFWSGLIDDVRVYNRAVRP